MTGLKYISFVTNDMDWEQSLHYLVQSRKAELQRMVERLSKRDFIADVRCQVEQW